MTSLVCVDRSPVSADRRAAGCLGREGGFTLLELVIVAVVIGILLAIAIPSSLGLKDKAGRTAAQANLRSALPSVMRYYSEHASYTGMTLAELRAFDSAIKLDPIVSGNLSETSYCVQATVDGYTFKKNGPAAVVVEDPHGCD